MESSEYLAMVQEIGSLMIYQDFKRYNYYHYVYFQRIEDEL